MPRYVILLHTLPAHHERPTHWDLMFEREGTLRTWAIGEQPAAGLNCEAEQLADHRVAYLDYEGTVSGDRGQVSRFDAGEYRVESESEDRWRMVLDGDRLRVRVELARNDARHSWRVSFAAEPISG